MQIWLEMAAPPTEDDKDMLETVLSAWFMIGRLGGYNSMNLQVETPLPLKLRIHPTLQTEAVALSVQ